MARLISPSERTRPKSITFQCDMCGGNIDHGAGYVEVDHHGAIGRKAGRWFGRRVKWHAVHRGCDPQPDTSTYWIRVEQIDPSSSEYKSDWWHHLTGKRWFAHTDGADFFAVLSPTNTIDGHATVFRDGTIGTREGIRTDVPTTLYRHYSIEHELLYVGISSRPMQRHSEHRRDDPWWTQVHHTTLEHFTTRQAALDAEKLAIQTEHPRLNIVHNNGRT